MQKNAHPPSVGATLRQRLSLIQPHEVLIFFILLVLFALCLSIVHAIDRNGETSIIQQTQR